MRAGRGHRFSRLHYLLLGFDGTRSGHYDEFVAANLAAIHADARSLTAKLPADEFVRRRDAHRLFDLWHGFDGFQTGGGVANADSADDNPLFPFDRVDLIAEFPYSLAHLLDLLPGRVEFHRDDHLLSP